MSPVKEMNPSLHLLKRGVPLSEYIEGADGRLAGSSYNWSREAENARYREGTRLGMGEARKDDFEHIGSTWGITTR